MAGDLRGVLRDPRHYGAQAPSPLGTTLSRVCTVLYFAFFILMPFLHPDGETKPVPERVTG